MTVKRQLNVMFLLILLGCTVSIVTAGYFVHGFQVSRNAGGLLNRAKAAADEGDYRAAAELQGRYLAHRRDDAVQYTKRAGYLEEVTRLPDAKGVDYRDALMAFEEAVRRNPGDRTLLRDSVNILMRMRQYDTAVNHLKILMRMQETPELELQILLAECYAETGQHGEASESLSPLIGFDPDEEEFVETEAPGANEVGAYTLLAGIFRNELLEGEAADKIIERMVEVNPKSYKAHVARGRYLLMNQGDEEGIAKAAESIGRAMELAGEESEVILLDANIAMVKGEYERATEVLERGLKLHPKNVLMYRSASDAASRQNQPSKAMEFIKRGLAEVESSLYLLDRRAELELQQADIPAAKKTIGILEKSRYAPIRVAVLQAQLVQLEGNWIEACRRFEKLRPEFGSDPSTLSRLDMQLAQCYGQLGQPDRQLRTFDRVSKASPDAIGARHGKANALRALGRSKEALEEYYAVARYLSKKSPGMMAQILPSLIDLLVDEQLRKDENERNWERADGIFNTWAELEPIDESTAAHFRAGMLTARGDDAGASAVVGKAMKDDPENISLRLWQVGYTARKEGPEPALAMLDQIEKETGDSIALRLQRAKIIAIAAAEDAGAALTELEVGIDEFEKADRLRLWRGLGENQYRLRDPGQTQRLWRLVMENDPHNLPIRMMLLDLAMDMGEEDDVTRAVDDVADLAGKNTGTWRYAEAVRQTWLFKSGLAGEEALGIARELLDEARDDRPHWHLVPLAEANLALLAGDQDTAINRFLKADELGSLKSTDVRRLAQMLVEQGNADEAWKVLERQRASQRTESDRRLETYVMIREGRRGEAVQLAQDIVAEDSTNASDHLWQGRMMAMAGRSDFAEAAFRRAVEVAPTTSTTWLSLVQLLVGMGKHPEALATIRAAQVQLPEADVPLVLGQCYQVMRNYDQARHYYLAALDADPANLSTLHQVANFYVLVNLHAEAMKYLDQMLQGAKGNQANVNPDVAWARRTKARLLAATGSYQAFTEALKLIEANVPAGGSMSPQDNLTWVSLSAQRPEPLSRQAAVRKLEEIEKEGGQLNDSLLLILAQLYEQANRWPACRKTMGPLLARGSSNPKIIEPWCIWLLKHDQPAEAQTWVKKLDPESAAAVRIRAHLAARSGRTQDVIKEVESLLPDPLPPEKVSVLRSIAILYEQLAVHDESLSEQAEEMYRRYVEGEPRGVLILANFLARRGRIDEALALCDQALAEQPLVSITQIGLTALRRNRSEIRPEHLAKVQSWFDRGERDFPDSKALLLQSAELEDIQGNYDRVIDIYRQYLARTDITARQKAIVQNNLAFVMSMRGCADDALDLIDAAIKELGPTGDLLDTRAMVHLSCGDAINAIADMHRALAGGKSPTKLFHQAMAELAGGNDNAAREAFQDAIELELTEDQLAPLERPKFRELQKKFGTE